MGRGLQQAPGIGRHVSGRFRAADVLQHSRAMTILSGLLAGVPMEQGLQQAPMIGRHGSGIHCFEPSLDGDQRAYFKPRVWFVCLAVSMVYRRPIRGFFDSLEASSMGRDPSARAVRARKKKKRKRRNVRVRMRVRSEVRGIGVGVGAAVQEDKCS